MRRLHLLLLGVYRRLPTRARRFVVRRMTPGFTVGSICVIERADGAVLLVRHSYRRRWGTPGGLLARGEVPADAAVREAEEEVGLAIELVGAPTVVVEPEARRVDVVFRCRPAAGVDAASATPRSTEITECRWFDPTELPELQAETAGAVRALARAAVAPASVPLPSAAER